MRSILRAGMQPALKDLAAISSDLARCLVEFRLRTSTPAPVWT